MLSAMIATTASFAFAPSASRLAVASRATPAAFTMMADEELSMLSAMSESFWKQKRARMKAELAAQLLELDEFEAREKALQQVAVLPAAGGGGSAELQAALDAEKAKTAALEAELAKTRLEAEVNMQKVAAFWIGKLDEAKSGALPAAAESPAIAAAPAPEEEPAPDMVGVPPPVLEAELSLRELRARLLSYGLSTIGVKSELRQRLEYALEHERAQYTQWDPATKSWK